MERDSLEQVPHAMEPSGNGKLERARLFAVATRNELKRVNWPTGREVYATTVVVIVASVALGVYLQALELLFDYFLLWLYGQFGVS